MFLDLWKAACQGISIFWLPWTCWCTLLPCPCYKSSTTSLCHSVCACNTKSLLSYPTAHGSQGCWGLLSVLSSPDPSLLEAGEHQGRLPVLQQPRLSLCSESLCMDTHHSYLQWSFGSAVAQEISTHVLRSTRKAATAAAWGSKWVLRSVSSLPISSSVTSDSSNVPKAAATWRWLFLDSFQICILSFVKSHCGCRLKNICWVNWLQCRLSSCDVFRRHRSIWAFQPGYLGRTFSAPEGYCTKARFCLEMWPPRWTIFSNTSLLAAAVHAWSTQKPGGKFLSLLEPMGCCQWAHHLLWRRTQLL